MREWQVIQESDGIRVLLARPDPSFDDGVLAANLRKELESLGVAATTIRIEHVGQVQRTTAGKAPLVRAHRPAKPNPAADDTIATDRSTRATRA